jgi:hypothetical protein
MGTARTAFQELRTQHVSLHLQMYLARSIGTLSSQGEDVHALRVHAPGGYCVFAAGSWREARRWGGRVGGWVLAAATNRVREDPMNGER